MESHISYPVLSYYRSQHDGQSWIAALTTILDACSFLLTSIEDGPRRQAQLTYAIARHALVDLCLIFNTPPLPPEPDRLPMEDYRRLCAALQRAGLPVAGDAAAYERLTSLRASYEPYIRALADGLLFLVPGWMPDDGAEDNWQSSAWDHGPHF
jgi:hypothetical protein